MEFAELLSQIRKALTMPPPTFIHIPAALMRGLARVSGHFSHSLLDLETFDMLTRGSTADAVDTRSLLHRDPRPVTEAFEGSDRLAIRSRAILDWVLPVLRFSVALVWIVTGVVSLGVYPREESYLLLARSGVPESLAMPALYSAAVLDLLLGVATLLMRRRRTLWLVQIALIVIYTVIITIKLPEFWSHPYGPIVKNLPLLAAIWLLYNLDNR
jgi:hypothetical protein